MSGRRTVHVALVRRLPAALHTLLADLPGALQVVYRTRTAANDEDAVIRKFRVTHGYVTCRRQLCYLPNDRKTLLGPDKGLHLRTGGKSYSI